MPKEVVNDHQDFDTIVFNTRNKDSLTQDQKKENYKKMSQSGITQFEKQLDQDSTGPVVAPKPARETRIAIQQCRLAHKLSQDQFAQKMNIQKSVVVEWENGKSEPKGHQLALLQRTFGVSISTTKNPKKSKPLKSS